MPARRPRQIPQGQGFLGPGGMADVMQRRAAGLPEPGYMPSFLGSNPSAEEIAAKMDPVMGMLGQTALKGVTRKALKKVAKDYPIEAYHGTGEEILGEVQIGHSGRVDKGWMGTGFYSTNKPRIANSYATMKAQRAMPGREAPNVWKTRLKMKNPYVTTSAEKMKMSGWPPDKRDAFARDLQKKGYDGIIIKYKDDPNDAVRGFEEYVVFNSDQIFDPNTFFGGGYP